MIKKVFNLFHQEFGGLHQAAMVLAASSFLSGLLALLRDRLLAGTFGAGRFLDVYYASFKIPDFLYTISLVIISVNVLIPFFLKKLSQSPQEAKKFFDNIFSIFLFAIIILTGIAFFLTPWFANMIAPGFSVEEKKQLILMARILLLSPFLLGISNLFSGIVQSFNRFFVYALSPVLYNLGIILGILFFYPYFGIAGLALGVGLGAFLHAAVQIPSIISFGFFPKIKLKLDFKESWETIKLSIPRTLGLSINQLVLIFITASASLFAAGSIAVFNISYNLQSVPMAIIGVSFSVAAFPTLAKLFVSNKKKEFIEHTVTAMRQIIFWSVPMTILIIVLRAQIVRVIYGYGKFNWQNTRLTAAGLAIFTVSLLAQSLVVLFVRAFYAAGKTLKPLVVNVISSVFIIGGSLLAANVPGIVNFVKPYIETSLRVKNVPGTEMLLLAVFFSVGTIINACILIKMFNKEVEPVWHYIKKALFEVAVASLIMGVVTYASLNFLDKLFNIRTFLGIFFQGFVSALFGLGFWFGVLHSAKNRELEEIVSSLKQKFWKTPAIAPEPEELP